MDFVEQLRALEEGLLQTELRKDGSQVAELLADDFREFGSSGRIYSKVEIIALLQEQEPAALSIMDFEVMQLSDSLVLVTYRFKRGRADEKPVESLRSSIWELRNGRWQMLFHQGTKIPAK